MNDLDLVRTMRADAPIPSPQRLDTGRERLLAAIDSRPAAPRTGTRRGFVRWTALAGGLAAAAGAVVFAVSGGSTPATPPVRRSPSSSPLSTRQVLLAAATTAERQPAADGAYWHVSTLREVHFTKEIDESWYGKDGYYWGGVLILNGRDEAGKPGTVYRSKKKSPRAFEVADHMFTLAQVRNLPTTAKGIEKWANGVARSVSPSWRRQDIDFYTDDLLIELLAEAPATPKTRAAAFRALAGRPKVKSAGLAEDEQGRWGYALIIGGTRYLIDPSRAMLLSQSTTVGPKHAAITYLKVGWTNETPHPPTRP
ncbi:CU044_5270 family protein [Actinoallomurus sp. CA-142502]|uniref:CU044_5270 family protein n=1 Tax=Actinoallomurus sp. CA-142502 TaxID=3239885 RepID=UPI003D945D71